MYTFRTLIVNESHKDLAAAIAAYNYESAGMFLREVGHAPSTVLGRISTGITANEMFDYWPMTVYDALGNVVSNSAGDAAFVSGLTGGDYTEAQVQSVFDNIDISNQEAVDALARLGYVLL